MPIITSTLAGPGTTESNIGIITPVPDTFAGGFPTLKAKMAEARGSAGSLTVKNTTKNNTSEQVVPSVNPSLVGKGPMTGISLLSNINTTLSDLATRFTNEVDEVTLSSKYYPSTQPFLARIQIVFPKEIEDTYKTIISNKGIATPAPIAQVAIGEAKTSLSAPKIESLVASTGGLGFGGGPLPSSVTSATSIASNPIYNPDPTASDFLEIRPNNFLNFEFQRIVNGIGKFTITLFDPQWDKIETKLVENKGFFKFKYGYLDAGDDAISPWYFARAFTYKLDFSMEGVTIAISGFTTGYALNISKTFSADGLDGQNLDIIVAAIANDLGFIPIVEPTKPIKSRDSMEVTNLINKIVNFTGQTKLNGILNDLAKYAINKQDEGNYLFFMRIKADGTKELHFHTLHYEPKESTATSVTLATSATSAVDTVSSSGKTQESTKVATKNVPGFTQFKNKNTVLRSFTPSWGMTITQIAGGGKTIAPNIDVNSKNLVIANMDMNNSPRTFDSSKGLIIKYEPTEWLPKDYEDDEKLKGFNLLCIPERSEEQNKAVAQAVFSKGPPGAIRATLEIFGTPNFYLTQKIAVFIFKPQTNAITITGSNIHWISGFFRIMKITDSIKAGDFITTFELVTEGRPTTAPDPVPTLQSK